MTSGELIELGFIDVSSRDFDDNYIQEFRLDHSDGFSVRVYKFHEVQIYLNENWIAVPGCQRIDSLKQLVKLFQLPF